MQIFERLMKKLAQDENRNKWLLATLPFALIIFASEIFKFSIIGGIVLIAFAAAAFWFQYAFFNYIDKQKNRKDDDKWNLK